MKGHLTQEEILEYLDGTLNPDAGREVRHHLEQCPGCDALRAELRVLDTALTALPLERASSGLSRSVMRRIMTAAGEPLGFRLLNKMAYVFALAIVLVVMGGVFVATGVLSPGDSGGGGSLNELQSLLDVSASATGNAVRIGSAWILRNIPYRPGSGLIGITVAIIVVVTGLALFDRIVGRRILGRS